VKSGQPEWGNLFGNCHFDNQEDDGRIMLKWILREISCEADAKDFGSCPVVGVGISGAETSGTIFRELVGWVGSRESVVDDGGWDRGISRSFKF
jgi:hypothetical protein